MLFIKDLIKNISSINTSNLSNIKSLENVVDLLICAVERAWDKNSKIINILKYSKNWWDISCSRDLEKYRLSRSLANWKQFKKTVKNTKCSFFWLEDLRNIEQGKRALGTHCYELKSLEWDKRTTLVLSNIRELNRELFYKLVYLI